MLCRKNICSHSFTNPLLLFLVSFVPSPPPPPQVGKYVLDLNRPGASVPLPLIVDVTLQSRTKIVSVHSAIHLVNRLPLSLTFTALLILPRERSSVAGVPAAHAPITKFNLGG